MAKKVIRETSLLRMIPDIQYIVYTKQGFNLEIHQIFLYLYVIYNYHALCFYPVMYQAALPFIGFGFFDNLIMITAVSYTMNACVVMAQFLTGRIH